MFNKKEFAELLIAAKGKKRSMRAYAMVADVSPAHLSRLSRELLTSPPTPDTLKKLASQAEDGVTLKSMMKACGYYEEPQLVTTEKHSEVARLLFLNEDSWSLKKGKYADYELVDQNGIIWEWIEGGLPEEVYGRLAMMPKPENKRSIVVRGKTEVEELLNHPPTSLYGSYSVILLSESNWKEFEFKY